MEFLCCSLIKPPPHTYDAVNPANTINTECLPTCFTFGQWQLCVSMSGASHLTTLIKQCHQIYHHHHQNYVILWTESRIPYKTLEYSPKYFSKYLFLLSSKHETTWQLQNGSLVQLFISASERKGVGNIPGGHVLKAFSALPSYS